MATLCVLTCCVAVVTTSDHCSALTIAIQVPPAHEGVPGIAVRARKNLRDGLVYVWVPPGTFVMGCSNGDEECSSEEKPAHPVTLSQGFWMGQTEVTVGAFERFAGISKAGEQTATSDAPSVGNAGETSGRMPIVGVTWDEAVEYCQWAGGRLPTEAEWEYAARAGSTAARYGPLDEIAWYQGNSMNSAHEVGEKPGNRFGLRDILGNVWEWVSDWYDGSYYSSRPAVDPLGPKSGQMRVLRGGAWLSAGKLVRLSDRGRAEPDTRTNYFGLRCVGFSTR